MNKRRDGFTTIELMVALLIAALIMAAAMSFLVFNVQNFSASKNDINLQREGQLVMNQLVELLSESYGIDNYNSASETYRFLLKERVEDNSTTPATVTYTDKIYTIRWDSSNNKILASVNGASEYVVGENIIDFSIRTDDGGGTDWDDTNLVLIKIKLEKGDSSKDYAHSDISLSQSVKMRNKSKKSTP